MKSTTIARTKIVPRIYRNVMNAIRGKAGIFKLWFSIDGTTDLNGNHLFVFIVGISNNLNESFVLNLWSLPTKSAENLKLFFEQSIQLLYPMSPILNGNFN